MDLNLKVSDLIIPQGEWNPLLLYELFPPIDAIRISSFPPNVSGKDRLIWTFSNEKTTQLKVVTTFCRKQALVWHIFHLWLRKLMLSLPSRIDCLLSYVVYYGLLKAYEIYIWIMWRFGINSLQLSNLSLILVSGLVTKVFWIKFRVCYKVSVGLVYGSPCHKIILLLGVS